MVLVTLKAVGATGERPGGCGGGAGAGAGAGGGGDEAMDLNDYKQ